MRLWFSGPRVLGGLVRPGISFNVNELKGKPSPSITRGEIICVLVKGDDIAMVTMRRVPPYVERTWNDEPPWMESIAFAFTNPGAADRVYDGAKIRLASHLSPEGAITGMSVGQVVAAIRSQASALGYEPTVARVVDENQKPADTKSTKEHIGIGLGGVVGLVFSLWCLGIVGGGWLVLALFTFGIMALYISVTTRR
jgi:hypothetical protein